jgi:hypothetical protein
LDLSAFPVTSFGLASLLLDATSLQFIAYQDSLLAYRVFAPGIICMIAGP